MYLLFILVLLLLFFFLSSKTTKDNFRHIPTKKKYLFAVYAQFKNEGHVINEWIDHYLKEGADHIFLVDNGSDDQYEIETRFLPRVSVSIIKTRHSQIQNGRWALQTIRRDFEWVLVVDLDEFVFTRNYPSLRDFLFKSDPVTRCLYIPWKMFGSGRHKRQPDSVIRNFLWRDRINTSFVEGRLVKSLFRTADADFGIHVPHYRDPRYLKYPYAYLVGNPGEEIRDGRIPTDIEIQKGEIALNHYAVQSWDFFRSVKMKRGSANTIRHDNVRNRAYFEKYDKNTEYDDELSRKRTVKRKPYLVMTRYRESLDFLDKNPTLFDHFDQIHVYNKGFPDVMVNRENVWIYDQINLGDAEESYMRFIVDHYYKDVTVLFTSASLFCYPNPHKENKFLFTLDRVLVTGGSVVCVQPISKRDRRSIMDWRLDRYRQTGLENRITTTSLLTPCVYRPFGEWLSAVVGIVEEDFKHVSYHGIFAIRSEDWRNRSRDFYHEIQQRLMQEHPEENHYLERAWAYLFRLTEDKMLFYDEYRLALDIPQIERWCENMYD